MLKSWHRSLEWRNEYQLFTSALPVCPLNAKVHYNVAKAADARQQTAWALEEYKEALRYKNGLLKIPRSVTISSASSPLNPEWKPTQ